MATGTTKLIGYIGSDSEDEEDQNAANAAAADDGKEGAGASHDRYDINEDSNHAKLHNEDDDEKNMNISGSDDEESNMSAPPSKLNTPLSVPGGGGQHQSSVPPGGGSSIPRVSQSPSAVRVLTKGDSLANILKTYQTAGYEDEDDDENETKDGGARKHTASDMEQSPASSGAEDDKEALSKYDLGSAVTDDKAEAKSPEADSFDFPVELPPSPKGRCSKKLIDKIARMHDLVSSGYDMNKEIEKRRDFRNPSIYEKLLEFCDIDEKGTNYPPEIFDPHCWGPESYYDALSLAQKAEMERRERERKERAKIEFVSGSKKTEYIGAKKPVSSSTFFDPDKKRSKWDAQPRADPHTSSSSSKPPERKGPIIPPSNIIPVSRSGLFPAL